VHLAGWHFAPDFQVIRDDQPVALLSLLAELAERVEVRMLAWAGAPVPVFSPTRRDMRKIRVGFTDHTSIRFALDRRERPMHCHHEKVVVIDDRVAFVGGIDLTTEGGDRYDTNEHRARAAIGWHDVCARIEGPSVSDVANHFVMRWREVTGEPLPHVAPSDPAGDIALQIVRTVPENVYTSVPQGDFGILESYLRALRGARRFIYLENQFLWSPEIAAVLADKLKNPPSSDFRILALLPAEPNSGADNTRGVLAKLIAADAEAGRMLACTLAARQGLRSDPIYLHAKLAIVDDCWLTIGSANLNEHSLFNDTEMNLVTRDAAFATQTRLRLWAEHLELSVEQIQRDPIEVIDEIWGPVSKEQLARRNEGRPLSHRLVRLPDVSQRSSRLVGPLSGLIVDG
jgi:phosphatidylserine/phosphatidylglycerophosphate/cardiolipin synthase-like enzyme